MPVRKRGLLLATFAATVVAADQFVKAAIVSAIGPGANASRINIVGDWFALEYAENRGMAFGLFAGLGPVLPFLALLIVGAMLIHYFRAPSPPWWETISIAAITGGAMGNLIDRIRLGFVVDFVSVGRWPNFNVADSAITVGVVIAIWGWLIAEPRQAGLRAGAETE